MIATEEEYWGDCWSTTAFFELIKQNYYQTAIGLSNTSDIPTNVIDLGGGPWSLLLRYRKGGTVIDLGEYPDWVYDRYAREGIRVIKQPAEVFQEGLHGSECWIYNLLQHVSSPEKIIKNARQYAPVIRIFEWIDIPPYHLHPQLLTHSRMLSMLRGMNGTAKIIDYNIPAHLMCARAFTGVFKETV